MKHARTVTPWTLGVLIGAGCSSPTSGAVADAAAGVPDAAQTVPDGTADTASAPDAPTADSGPGSLDEASADAPFDANVPAIDPNLDSKQLTLAQKGELCDWANAALGGYGTSTDCGGSGTTISNAANQAECLASQFTSSCQMTVRQYEACILYMAPSHGCRKNFDLCAPARTCYTATPRDQ